MSKMTLKDISKAMREIDICMMTTSTSANTLEARALESRPMSNNREVDYTGDSYFFTYDHYDVAKEIAAMPEVNLAYIHRPTLIGKDIYISVTGKADLVGDKAQFEQHWSSELDAWFPQGTETPGLVMIHVRATRLNYWQGMEKGEVALTSSPDSRAA